jgi:hypothetical protein
MALAFAGTATMLAALAAADKLPTKRTKRGRSPFLKGDRPL